MVSFISQGVQGTPDFVAQMAASNVQQSKDSWLFVYSKRIPGLGFMLAILSGVCFATAGFSVEMMPRVDPTVAVVYRSVAQLVVYGLIGIWQDMPLGGVKGERLFVVLRSIGGFASFSLGYYSFWFMTFSDANTICMSAPVYVGPFAWIFLKEKCGLFQSLMISVTVLGIVLISRPAFIFGSAIEASFSPHDQLIGAGLSLACALGITTSVISLRKCVQTPASVVIIWFSFLSIVFGLVVLVLLKFVVHMDVGVPVTTSEWIWINVNAICGVLGQCVFVWSLKIEEAGLVTLARTFDVVMAFMFQIAFLDQIVVWTSIVGSLIVCSTVGVTCLKKVYDSRPDKFAVLAFLCRSKPK